MDTKDMNLPPDMGPNGLFSPPSNRTADVHSRNRADFGQISLNLDHGSGQGIGGQIPHPPLVKPYQAVPTDQDTFLKKWAAIFLHAPLERRSPNAGRLP